MPAAMKTDLLGDISFVWGENDENNKGYGFKHIIEKHGLKVARNIPEVINKGRIIKVTPNKITIEHKTSRVIIRNSSEDSETGEIGKWVLSDFELYPSIKAPAGLHS